MQERVRIRMEHILKQIKLEYDLYMTRTYLDTAIDSLPDMLWFKAMGRNTCQGEPCILFRGGKGPGGCGWTGPLLYLGRFTG